MRSEPLFIRFSLQFYETAVIYNLKVEMLWPGHGQERRYRQKEGPRCFFFDFFLFFWMIEGA